MRSQGVIRQNAKELRHGTVRVSLLSSTLLNLSLLNMTVTKAELTRKIVEAVGLTQYEAKDMVDAFFSEIAAYLMRGEEVKLSGFGSFETRDKVERPGRNPVTGDVVMVTARRVVAFRASRNLKLAAATKKTPDLIRKAG